MRLLIILSTGVFVLFVINYLFDKIFRVRGVKKRYNNKDLELTASDYLFGTKWRYRAVLISGSVMMILILINSMLK